MECQLQPGANLHDISQLCTVQVLLGNRPEEVYTPFVDAQYKPWGQQANWVLYTLHSKKRCIAIRQCPQDAHELCAGILFRMLRKGFVPAAKSDHEKGGGVLALQQVPTDCRHGQEAQ